MPSRIPLKILRLTQIVPGQFTLAPANFLAGVTTNNIERQSDGSELININQTPIGQPLSGTQQNVVYEDDFGKYVILDGGRKYYISDPAKSNQDPVPSTFEFYVNPTNLTLNYQKIVSETRTRGGWEIQHWGDALTEITVNGKSGGMHRRVVSNSLNNTRENTGIVTGVSSDGIPADKDVTDTLAYLRIKQLKRLYDTDHSARNRPELTLLGIGVYDNFYVGYFTRFAGPNIDANDPWQFAYSFTIKVLYEYSMSRVDASVKSVVTSGTQIGNTVESGFVLL